MLSKQSTVEDIETIFKPYGNVTEVFLMKNKETGESRGSAFVKMSSKDSAERSIASLNNLFKDKDAPNTLQVRMAHSAAEKAQKGGGGNVPYQGYGGYGGPPAGGGYGGGYGMGGMPPAGPMGPGPMGGMAPPPMDAYGRPTGGYGAGGYGGYGAGAGGYGVPPANPYQQQGGYDNMGGYGAGANTGAPQGGSTARPDVTKGPAGSNLFVYGLPENYSDSDLYSLFSSFGTIVSTKVQVDMHTGITKGFGFVSFDNPSSASSAISAMDGFVLGAKRLIVKLKTSKGETGHGQNDRGRYAPY